MRPPASAQNSLLSIRHAAASTMEQTERKPHSHRYIQKTLTIRMPKFEWDENKNASNRQKHNIGFERAKDVFEDEDAINYLERITHGESRFLIVGKILDKFIIAVVFTIRAAVYRIISARQASNNEIKDYIANKFDKNDSES